MSKAKLYTAKGKNDALLRLPHYPVLMTSLNSFGMGNRKRFPKKNRHDRVFDTRQNDKFDSVLTAHPQMKIKDFSLQA